LGTTQKNYGTETKKGHAEKIPVQERDKEGISARRGWCCSGAAGIGEECGAEKKGFRF